MVAGFYCPSTPLVKKLLRALILVAAGRHGFGSQCAAVQAAACWRWRGGEDNFRKAPFDGKAARALFPHLPVVFGCVPGDGMMRA